jgi:broad specificity phosphatase PhoE
VILYLVRHGETTYNRDGLALGRADVPLTEMGERQAAALAARLAAEPLARVLSSPLGRARETAMAIAGERGIPVDVRDELIEMDVGETEGIAFPEMRARYAALLADWLGPQGHEVTMPGGESLVDVEARVAPLLAEFRGDDDEALAIVAHNFVLKTMLCRLLGVELSAFRTFATDLASISTVSLRGERTTLRALNDCCHLESLNLDRGGRSL